jgi:O-antigen ligase
VDLNVAVPVQLPPGEYRLAWGMFQQQVLWFHDRGYPDAETMVHVSAGGSSVVSAPVNQSPRNDLFTPPQGPVPRTELWSAAFEIIRQHPLLGVGPDNFRHIYGTYLGLSTFDDKLHANNLYLELLADVGVLGAAAFALLVALPLVSLVRGLRRTPSRPWQALCLAGFGASLLAYCLHSGLDSFLEFTPVFLLFWVIVGLTAAASEPRACERSAASA